MNSGWVTTTPQTFTPSGPDPAVRRELVTISDATWKATKPPAEVIKAAFGGTAVLYPDPAAYTLWADIGGGQKRSAAGLKAAGCKMLCFKVSEGKGYVDPARVANYDTAMSLAQLWGIPPCVGMYTFPLPDSCGMKIEDQAQRDFSLMLGIAGLDIRTVWLMLDVETQPAQGSWGPFSFGKADDLFRYVRAMRAAGWGQRPIVVYSGAWYWQGVLGNPKIDGVEVLVNSAYSYGSINPRAMDWILNTGPDGTGVTWNYNPRLWGGSTLPTFRQFTDASSVDGQATDANIAWMGYDALRAVLLGAQAPPPPPPPPLEKVVVELPVLRAGSTGPAVITVQQILSRRVKVSIDGNYGPQTVAAVQGFQTLKRIPSNGIVNVDTWAALVWQG